MSFFSRSSKSQQETAASDYGITLVKQAAEEGDYYGMHTALFHLSLHMKAPEAPFVFLSGIETIARKNIIEGLTLVQNVFNYVLGAHVMRGMLIDKGLELAARTEKGNFEQLLQVEALARTFADDFDTDPQRRQRALDIWSETVKAMAESGTVQLRTAFMRAGDAAGDGRNPQMRETAEAAWDKLFNALAARDPVEAEAVALHAGNPGIYAGARSEPFRRHADAMRQSIKH